MNSALHSWRLLDSVWRIYLLVAAVFLIVGSGGIYSIAVERPDPILSGRILDVICSVVFVFFFAKAAVASWETWVSSTECKKIYEELARGPTPEQQRDLVADYNVERAGGPSIPTWVYLWQREKIQADWLKLRDELFRSAEDHPRS